MDGYQALQDLERLIISYPCEEGENKYLILAGDICNEAKIDGLTSQVLRKFISNLAQNHVLVYGIQGNHDRQSVNNPNSIPLISAHGGLYLHKKTVQMDDLSVYGLDYMPPEKLKEELQQAPACDMVVLHTAFEHMLGFDGAWDLTLDDVPDRIRSVIAGDIHKTVHCPVRHSDGIDGDFLSPGALHACAVDQGSVHGVFVRPYKGDWSFAAIESRPIVRLLYETQEQVPSADAFLESLPKSKLLPVVEIRYKQEAEEAVEKLLQASDNRCIILSYKLSQGKTMETVGMRLENASEQLIRLPQALPFILDRKQDPEVYMFLETLLDSPEPVGDIDLFVQQQLA
jgi:DNA repair exonuclease SbcCD nuclease subunit